jgi:uncharacterized membrane protein YadS
LLHLSQEDFGLWCAIAIHDTSSVVAAANKYGPQALQIATTVKLASFMDYSRCFDYCNIL